MRLWDLAARLEIDRIDLPGPIGALAVASDGALIVGFGWDIVVLDRITGGFR